MSSAIKLTSMVNICLTSSNPTLYATKFQYPSVSLLSKPIQFLNLLSSSSSSLSLNKKNEVSSSSIIIAQVAQTSDWAQQEKEEEVTEIESGEESEGDEFSGGFFPEPPEEAKLFVGNLPYDMDSDNLAQLFDGAGVVEIAEVNRDTDQSRGFGFVTMSTLEEAEKAVEMFNRYDINGRLLTVNKAAPRGSRLERSSQSFEPALRIYVGNLPWQVDDSRLEQVFSEHGKVVDARVVYDRDSGRSRGFGFVTMSTQSELDDAIASLDGQSLDGRTIRVNVAEERPRRSSF